MATPLLLAGLFLAGCTQPSSVDNASASVSPGAEVSASAVPSVAPSVASEDPDDPVVKSAALTGELQRLADRLGREGHGDCVVPESLAKVGAPVTDEEVELYKRYYEITGPPEQVRAAYERKVREDRLVDAETDLGVACTKPGEPTTTHSLTK